MLTISPGRKLAEIKIEFDIKASDNTKVDERIANDSLYLKLLKEKAFLLSKIAMAETDSIYLTLNLADSTANIGISGVIVHKARISNMKVSNILMKGNGFVIFNMISTPLKISKD